MSCLGVELGSTRIKAVKINKEYSPVASGDYTWASEFKTPIVRQKYMAAACKAPVTVMKTAGEGGAYGIALLAAFTKERQGNETLEEYLDKKVFKNVDAVTIQPDIEDMNGFDKYIENYMKLLEVEKSAIENV